MKNSLFTSDTTTRTRFFKILYFLLLKRKLSKNCKNHLTQYNRLTLNAGNRKLYLCTTKKQQVRKQCIRNLYFALSCCYSILVLNTLSCHLCFISTPPQIILKSYGEQAQRIKRACLRNRGLY